MIELIPVFLTAPEMDQAWDEAEARQAAIRARQATSNGPTNQTLDNDLIGVMGELAFAKWSGLPWTASKGAHYDDISADVGNLEVRTRRINSDKNMTLKLSAASKYDDDRLYVLAWASIPEELVYQVGYTSLHDIRVYGDIREDWRCYVYPWDKLADLRRLRVQS